MSESGYFTKIGGPLPRRADRTDRDKKMHAVFSLIGMLAGAGAAFVAWEMSETISLPIFAFFAVNYLVGRGVGDLVTDDNKTKRFFFFFLPVVIDSVILYLTYQWWGLMWLSVIIGFVIGAAVWAPVAVIAFADINAEEQRDTKERMEDAMGGGENAAGGGGS